MRFRITGKQAAQIAGCAVLCLIVCTMSIWNRTLVMEPVSAFLRGNSSYEEMKSTVQQNYLGDRLRGKFELLSLNGGYARLQGRIQYNGTLRMTNGMLTGTASGMTDTKAFTDNLSRYCRYLNGMGIPFLFVMAPYKVPEEENLLPAGVTDMTNAVADRTLAELSERDVPVMDLRKEMSRTREQVEKYFYRTDTHWNVDGSFFAYQKIMEEVQTRFPGIKASYTDPSLWAKKVIPKWWLGTYGRRVGPLFSGVDDLDYSIPTFETEMSRYSLGVWTIKGDFRKACIREWFLENSDYFRMDNYNRYLGGGYPLTYHRNRHAENQMKLLLIRDSFMLPVECFLSTEFTSIDVLDPREYGGMSEMDYAALNPPDMVILMVNPGILTSTYYANYTNFGEEKTLEVAEETYWEEIIASGISGDRDYEVLPVRLESGKSYELILDRIQTKEEVPDGASIVLYDEEGVVDQTVFDIEYGNQFEFHWGFQIPEKKESEENYQLRLYAGISGGTEGMEVVYQGIRLRECILSKP